MAQVQTILLVDDEPLIREGLADHLEGCGFTVIRASSGDTALNILEDPHYSVDLVFTDLRMPGRIDGMGLLKWIAANRAHIPVFVASGNLSKEAAANELCGAEAMGKPFDYGLVTKKIRAALTQRASKRPN